MKLARYAIAITVGAALCGGCQPAKQPDAATDTAQTIEQAAEKLEADATSLGKSLTETFSTLAAKLGEATDVEAAKAAIPALEKVAAELDQLRGKAEKLPDHAKLAFRAIVSAGVKPVQKKIKEVRDKEGVGQILQPALDAISEKLAKLAG
jgi:hypothetical protein